MIIIFLQFTDGQFLSEIIEEDGQQLVMRECCIPEMLIPKSWGETGIESDVRESRASLGDTGLMNPGFCNNVCSEEGLPGNVDSNIVDFLDSDPDTLPPIMVRK